MSEEEFAAYLRCEGFPEPIRVAQPAGGELGMHSHDFEVKALVIDGTITIGDGNIETSFGVGDVFHLAFQQPHWERYGDGGVRYLASRKSH